MEDTLRDGPFFNDENPRTGLNPCFNGRYS